MSKAKVLIVEDEYIIALNIQDILQAKGYEVCGIAASGSEAVMKARELEPDIVIIDIVLQGEEDGINVIEEIKKKSDIPFIFLTAHSDEITLNRVKATEPYGYILKPIKHAELTSTIKIALHKHEIQKELKASEERYRKLVELAPVGIILITSEGKVVSCNKAMIDISGYSLEDFQKFNVIESYVDEVDRKKIFKELKEKEYVSNFPSRFRRKNGEIFEALLSVSAVQVGSKKMYQTVCIDISERKKAEEKLEKWAQIFQHADIGIATIKPGDNKMELMNPAFAEMHGYNINELAGMSIIDLFAPDFREDAEEYIYKSSSNGHIRFESYHIKKDNQIFPVLVDITAGRDLKSRFDFIIINVQDISERRRAEMALMQSEILYHELIDTSPDPVVILQDGIYKFVNMTFLDLFEYDMKDIDEGLSFFNLVQEKDIPGVRERYQKRISGEDVPKIFRIDLMSKTGRIVPCETSGTLIKYNNKNADLVIIRDVSERIKAEKIIIDSLREKEILLKEIHHRVKNNMQIISSLLRLQSQYVKYDEDRELFNESQNRIISMSIIHEMMYNTDNFSKIDFGIYINELVEKLLYSYNTDRGKVNVQIYAEGVFLDINKGIPCALILNELISNSLKYAFPEDNKGEIKIQFLNEKNIYSLHYQDNGVGFSGNIDEKNGNSFGLELVNSLVGQLGGNIKFRQNQGINININFPCK